ncbi:hypothetical protein PHMEG_00017153 [Phytophthora megakarya]|uniref:Transmembrane protein n=1 Tax=Phytophthora megakarya TaxID=4795 RepID=A0A225VXA6_9STRA|nr:hypothetical protein PHMEG_00017153 [Phytophthora megakarya]
MFGWSCFIGYLTTTNPAIFKYKFDCYVNTLATHGLFTGISLTMKKIYYRESCQGRDRLAQQKQNQSKKKLTSDTKGIVTSHPVPVGSRKQILSYWRLYIKEFPKSLPAAVAGTFVHVLSQQRIMDRGNMVITCFLIASFVLKFAIQDAIKRYIHKHRIRSVRVMCAAVALPTVLIDTQTRIILLGTQSTHLLALGTFGMAFFEICLRVGKSHYVMRTIRNHEANIPSGRKSTTASSKKNITGKSRSIAPTPSRIEFEMWRGRVLAFHVAEIYADTYAEYIAIGCSASILVFFGNHPHYSLLRKLDSVPQLSTQLPILGFQVFVEILVDFISTALEMMAGIDFDLNRNVAAFLALFLAAIAVLNINISVGVYLF